MFVETETCVHQNHSVDKAILVLLLGHSGDEVRTPVVHRCRRDEDCLHCEYHLRNLPHSTKRIRIQTTGILRRPFSVEEDVRSRCWPLSVLERCFTLMRATLQGSEELLEWLP